MRTRALVPGQQCAMSGRWRLREHGLAQRWGTTCRPSFKTQNSVAVSSTSHSSELRRVQLCPHQPPSRGCATLRTRTASWVSKTTVGV